MGFLSTLSLAVAGTLLSSQLVTADQIAPHVLVYTATDGFRHDSIPTSIEVLKNQLGAEYGIKFNFTEDGSWFNDETLSNFDGLFFISTTGDCIKGEQQGAFQRYLQSGGVLVACHAATAGLLNDKTWNQAIGTMFNYHPEFQPAIYTPLDHEFPATRHLPERWNHSDEVYFFTGDPRSQGAQVILTVDDSTYNNPDHVNDPSNNEMGSPHPIAWYMEAPASSQPLLPGATKGGRSFYTALGHSNETWHDPVFQQHMMGGLVWALQGASTRAFGVGLVGNNNTADTVPTLNPTAGIPTSTSSKAPEPTETPITNNQNTKQEKSGASSLAVSGSALVGALVAAAGLALL